MQTIFSSRPRQLASGFVALIAATMFVLAPSRVLAARPQVPDSSTALCPGVDVSSRSIEVRPPDAPSAKSSVSNQAYLENAEGLAAATGSVRNLPDARRWFE